MEHSIMNSDGLSALASQLGCEFDGTFIVTDETPDALDEIQRMVFSENSYYRSTRRNLALLNVIEKSLVPLILYVCEDDEEDEEEEDDTFLTSDEKKSIYSKAVNLLMSLTLPLECLNSAVERYHIPHIQEKVREDVSKLFCAAKQAFLNFRLCNAILHTCKKLIQPLQEGKILETSSCQALNFTILLLRNILFLPDTQRSVNEPDSHIAILRLLFKSGLSDLILDLLASRQHQYWCVSLVQLISLLYKDQKYVAKEFVYDDTSPCVHTIGSGATVCSEGSFWWCANDTCSENTTTSLAKEDKASDELSNESTLKENDSQDDSKDGSGNSQDGNSQDSTLNGVCPPHNSEDSIEHPYGTASTEAVQAMTERLLNLERSVNCKLVYWQVNEELLSFTEALLHRGFSNLVISLKTLLITNESNGLSSLYFTWIIAHFLRLARQIKAPFSVLRICLSVDIVGYLAYLGVSSAEEIIVNHGRNLDVKHPSRSNHLVVRALYEVLLIIRYIDHKKLTNEERHVFRALTGHLIRVKDLRQLFLLFIRHLSPDIVSVQHLADVACTNHQFLIVAESVLSWENSPPFNMLSHVKSFATGEIMNQYGKLLDRYEENSHEVNECVLTLMHHIAGDCDKHETLLQFPIIRKIAEIANYSSLSAESKDLVHFLIQRFIALANSDPFQCSQYMFSGAREAEDEPDGNEEWKEEEMDELFQLHAEYSGQDNMLDSIVEGLEVNNIFKTKQQIIVKLYAQGLLAQEEIDCLNGVEMGNSNMEADTEETKIQTKPTGSISESVERLQKQEFHDHLTWMQDLLLELCFIKLGGRSLSNCEIAEDPVPLYYAIQGKSVPFVAYTREQEDFLRNEDFLQLLQLMGFHLAEDSGQYFPRVPHFWNPEDLLFKTQQLGPVDMEQQKFTMKDVEANANWWSSHMTPQATNMTNIDCDEKMNDHENQPGDLWHIFVRQCNIRPHLQNLKYKIEES